MYAFYSVSADAFFVFLFLVLRMSNSSTNSNSTRTKHQTYQQYQKYRLYTEKPWLASGPAHQQVPIRAKNILYPMDTKQIKIQIRYRNNWPPLCQQYFPLIFRIFSIAWYALLLLPQRIYPRSFVLVCILIFLYFWYAVLTQEWRQVSFTRCFVLLLLDGFQIEFLSHGVCAG